MITRLKKTTAVLGVFLLLSAAGMVSGTAVQNATADVPAFCEGDICKNGLVCMPSPALEKGGDRRPNGPCGTYDCYD